MMRCAAPIFFLLFGVSTGIQAGSVDLPVQIGGPFSVPTTSIKEARFKATLRQQYDFSCGSAALATLLTHHYGTPTTEEQVFKLMYERGDRKKIQREGFSLLDMKLFLENLGYRADGVEGTLDQLASAKIPAIALVKENGYHHFIVIKGVKDHRVVIGDPALGTRVLHRADFERVWTNGVLFVIHNRMELAQFNRSDDWAVRPKAPIGSAFNAAGVDALLLRRGSGDF